MSIAALQQTEKELRRLSIAGSALARDDFRLAKLVPVLQKSGQKAPIFGRIAAGVEGLVAAPADETAAALLRVTTLVHAVLYTQLQSQVEGALTALPTHEIRLSSRPASAKVLRSVIEALTTTGSGRLEVVREAHASGLFDDLRLLQPALLSLDDPYPEVADFMRREVLPAYGRAILPLLRASFDPGGGAGHARRLAVMLEIMDPEERQELCAEVLKTGSWELRATALRGLEGAPGARELVVEHLTDRAKEVRAAAYRVLGTLDDVLDPLLEAMGGKDANLAAVALGRHLARRSDATAAERVVERAEAYREGVLGKKRGFHVSRLLDWYRALRRDPHGVGVTHLLEVHADRKALARLRPAVKADISGADLVRELEELLSRSGDDRATAVLLDDLDLKDPWSALAAALRTRDPSFVYDTFHPLLTSDRFKREHRELISDHLLRHLRRERATLDPRWIDAALLRNHRLLVIALRPRDHARAIDYLAGIARDWSDNDREIALEALADTTFDRWLDLLAHRLRHYSAVRRRWHRPFEYGFLRSFPFHRLTDEELAAAESLPFSGPEAEHDAYRTRLAEERFRRLPST